MSILKIATLLVMSALLGSCDKHYSKKNPCVLNAQSHPVELLAGQLSYSPYEKYTNLFSDSSIHWIEREGDFGQGGPSVNRFEVNREFLGHTGRLEYLFYFRRLAELRFHPDNPSLFFQTARSKGLIASDGEERLIGDLRYWAYRKGAVEYFGAADARITRSFMACIASLD